VTEQALLHLHFGFADDLEIKQFPVALVKSGPRTICLDIESAVGVGLQVNGNLLVFLAGQAVNLGSLLQRLAATCDRPCYRADHPAL